MMNRSLATLSLALLASLLASLTACAVSEPDAQDPNEPAAAAADKGAPIAQAAGATLTASPGSVSVSGVSGNVIIPVTVTITNTGASTVGPVATTLTRVLGTIAQGSWSFASGGNACAGQNLAAGASCQIGLEFQTACSNVTRTVKWNLTASASGATVVVPLTGTTFGGICQ